MAENGKRSGRRQQILEALAQELESHPGTRITTARLAEVVGVSEAALYRHFPSKAKMFEGLLEFAEETVFGLTRRILEEETAARVRVERLLLLLLTFAARNPGITRVLLGDALVGEHERLRARGAQFFDRYETQLRQILREDGLAEPVRPNHSATCVSSILTAVAEGRLSRFCRSGFARSPVENWDVEWEALAASLLRPAAIHDANP